ncbi:MAG TPA: hypothetical protein VFA65_24545 [Bryobacteraceae bacterium]|nr:hypothetical protein [Bryobacteraceae bacterium]
MTDHAVIAAQLVDARNVGLHKFVKLTLHVPAEQALDVVRAFGWPTASEPVPVAIARLDVAAIRKEVVPAEPKRIEPASVFPPPARAPAEKRLAQLAGILCHETRFWKFLSEHISQDINSEEDAAGAVRAICDVESRADILPDTEAWRQFDLLLSKYAGWKADLE